MGRESDVERRARLERAGTWLRRQREDRGWTGTELARRLGLNQVRISAFERGQYEVDPGIARDIARVLGLTELETWKGLDLPLPAELDADKRSLDRPMTKKEKVDYVNRLFPGLIDEIKVKASGTKTPRSVRRGTNVARSGEVGRPPSQGEEPAV